MDIDNVDLSNVAGLLTDGEGNVIHLSGLSWSLTESMTIEERNRLAQKWSNTVFGHIPPLHTSTLTSESGDCMNLRLEELESLSETPEIPVDPWKIAMALENGLGKSLPDIEWDNVPLSDIQFMRGRILTKVPGERMVDTILKFIDAGGSVYIMNMGWVSWSDEKNMLVVLDEPKAMPSVILDSLPSDVV